MKDIDIEIEDLTEKLINAKGRPCEVYTRICGYYRPVTSWNTGKSAELAERKVFACN